MFVGGDVAEADAMLDVGSGCCGSLLSRTIRST